MLAVKLRPEETRSPLQDLVRTPQLANFLLQAPHSASFHDAHPDDVAVVDVGLLDPHPHRLDPVAELRCDPLDRPVLSPELGPKSSHHAHRCSFLSGEYRRAIGFPDP